MDKPLVLPVKKIVKENAFIKTFVFEHSLNSKPGQFVMLWLPGVDEKPFSTSFDNGKEFWLTVFKLGSFTTKMFDLKIGDKVGIRGPYGKGFQIKEKQNLVLVGGGCGSAPLFSVLPEAKKKNCQVDFILGARSKEFLFFEKNIKEYKNVKLHICTDDGSAGVKGFTTEVLEKTCGQAHPSFARASLRYAGLRRAGMRHATRNKDLPLTPSLSRRGKEAIDLILTCGPEKMMVKILEIAEKYKISGQLSLERYMKCGFGICGNCVLDPEGLRVCKDGPVFEGRTVRKVKDFGKYHRDAEGKKMSL